MNTKQFEKEFMPCMEKIEKHLSYMKRIMFEKTLLSTSVDRATLEDLTKEDNNGKSDKTNE